MGSKKGGKEKGKDDTRGKERYLVKAMVQHHNLNSFLGLFYNNVARMRITVNKPLQENHLAVQLAKIH